MIIMMSSDEKKTKDKNKTRNRAYFILLERIYNSLYIIWKNMFLSRINKFRIDKTVMTEGRIT